MSYIIKNARMALEVQTGRDRVIVKLDDYKGFVINTKAEALALSEMIKSAAEDSFQFL